MLALPEPAGVEWTRAAETLRPLFGGVAFELRFSLDGRAAVRLLAPHGPVAPRHAESREPPAHWSARVRCGDATGWLLANAAPADGERASEILAGAVERHIALVLQRLAVQRSEMATDLLERLTHQLRTDVATLQAVAEGAVGGVFDAGELQQIPGELRTIGDQAQRRLSSAREVMSALRPAARARAEPLVEVLRAELDGAGVAVPVAGVEGERPMTVVAGAGWGACARLLAAALAGARLGGHGAHVAVRPHPGGWAVTAGHRGPAAQRIAWTEHAVGELVHAGQIVAAAGGSASATQLDRGRLAVELTLPAAPSRGGSDPPQH
jgi:hypothetical protein